MSRGKALGRGMAKAAKMARYWFETPGRITPIKLRNVPWLGIVRFYGGTMLTNSSIRLNKYISESGICSRRDGDRYIEQGNVFINGKRATVGDQVFAGDVVKVNGQIIEPRDEEDLVFIALNKPAGIITTMEEGERDNISDFVNHSKRVFPIGRLDKDSQGLIFLTNHGDLVNKILRAGNNHEKEYVVTVNKPVTDEFIQGMSAGVPILGTVTKKCKVQKEAPWCFVSRWCRGLTARFAACVNTLVMKSLNLNARAS